MENWNPSIDPTFRKNQCLFFTWPWAVAADPVFEEETLHEQDGESKSYLFRDHLPTHEAQIQHGRQVLERLREIDSVAAELFGIKPYLIEGMTLRLINGETTESPKSYSALSYCWPQEPIAAPESGQRHFPISNLLYQHLILQRETSDEGVWCDQLCIDQSNKTEKAATISAMDAVYACARVVVVALEDIEVTVAEQQFLRAFILDYEDDRWEPIPPPHMLENPPFMTRHPILLDFFVKVCSSRWFKRAWCSHEMRLARRHRFLIRCAAEQGQPQQTLMSFSDFFLSYLITLSSWVTIPSDVRPLRQTLARVFSYSGYINELRRILTSTPRLGTSDETHIAAYTADIADIFDLGAGGDPDAADRERDANLDRCTILLNTVGNGLSLKRENAASSPLTATMDQCQSLLLILSLAAGDPTALCTNGPPFRLVDGQGASWLRKPSHTDVGSGASQHERLPRMKRFNVELDPNPGSQWINLDVFLPGELQAPAETLKVIADFLVNECRHAGLGGGFLGQMAQGPEYLGWRMEADFLDWRTNFIGIVTVMLQFGSKWMLGMAAKCGFASPTVLEDVKKDVEEHFPDGFDLGYLTDTAWTESRSSLAAVNAVLRIAYWVVGWSMSIMPQTSPERATWKPFICSFGGRVKALVIAQDGSVPVIPEPLLRAGYDRLPRVWLLDQSGVEGLEPRPAIKGKSVLFADLSDDDYSALLDSCPRGGMKIYGSV